MTPILKMSNAGGMDATLNRYSDMLAGNAAYVNYSFYSIATQTVGSGGASSITFSSIPSTYTHLQIRASLISSVSDWCNIKINNDTTGGNYDWHVLYGTGSSTGASWGGGSSIGVLNFLGNSSYPSTAIIDILDYTNTNKYKTIRSINGYDGNGSGQVNLISNLYQSTSAITQLDLQLGSSGTFNQYTKIALYGVK